MIMISATPLDTDSRVHLAETLAAAGLPIADLDQPGRSFFRFDAEATVGFGGLEGEGADRLLRSLVVLPASRHCGNGRAILAALETADRTCAGSGKRVSVRVDIGGRGIRYK